MKQINLAQLTALVLLPAAALSLTSCSTPKGDAEASGVIQTRDGAMVLDTYRLTATVTALDLASRQVLLTGPDGRRLTFKATPAINLSQFHIGNKINVITTEGIALFLAKPGSAQTSSFGAAVPVRVRGYESEALAAQTWETTAKILGLDAKSRRLALLYVSGDRGVVRAGPKVDLAELSVGDAVSAQLAEALIVAVQK